MAHLHLPEQHSTDDLVLAGQIAEAFESEDLFVVWTHDDGPGGTPVVQALLRDAPPNPIAGMFAAFFAVLADVWRAMTRTTAIPLTHPPDPADPADPAFGRRQAA